MKEKQLSWALIIATYNRQDVLVQCILHTLNQTYLPAEIIIIDASDNWNRSHEVLSKILDKHNNIRFVYEPAKIKSTTTQRNQGIDLSLSDIAFLIDDDSMMFPDCAEHIMTIYNSDIDGKIAGVAAEDTNALPPSIDNIDDSSINFKTLDQIPLKKTGGKKWDFLPKDFIFKFIRKKILMMDIYQMYVPSKIGYPSIDNILIPTNLNENNVSPRNIFPGYAMTFRKDIIKSVRFDPLLRGYAAAEDIDASYRASFKGTLLVAHNAKLNHLSVASGRVNRYISSLFLVTNNAVFSRKHCLNAQCNISQFYIWVIRRCFAELLKDLFSGRYDLPQFRGSLSGGLISKKILKMSHSEMYNWYPSYLEKQLSKSK